MQQDWERRWQPKNVLVTVNFVLWPPVATYLFLFSNTVCKHCQRSELSIDATLVHCAFFTCSFPKLWQFSIHMFNTVCNFSLIGWTHLGVWLEQVARQCLYSIEDIVAKFAVVHVPVVGVCPGFICYCLFQAFSWHS